MLIGSLCFIAVLLSVPALPQSLAEAARRENERRRSLQEQGVSGKVIEQHELNQGRGNLSVMTTVSEERRPEEPMVARDRPSLQSFRGALQKLEREIRQGEDRLTLLKERIKAARRAGPALRRSSRSGPRAPSVERLQEDAHELAMKLKWLRQDRLETYNAGRRAGFLPGELEGTDSIR